MEIITTRVTRQHLQDRCTTSYPFLTKAVVDVARAVMAVDAEWHADLEAALLDDGSTQEDLWGVNLMLAKPADGFVVFTSLINIRPAQRNFGMEIADPAVRAVVEQVVDGLVDYGQTPSVAEMRVPYVAGLAAVYPCFRHHKQLTMAKWRSFAAYKRVMMVDNELSRAMADRGGVEIWDCYERALELLQITREAAVIEGRPAALIHGLLRLRERVGRLYAERIRDPVENQRLRDALIGLEPQAWSLLHQGPAVTA